MLERGRARAAACRGLNSVRRALRGLNGEVSMKRLAAFVFGLAVLTGGLGAARADEPLAGASQFATSHGQPFCQTRAQLQALLDAQIAQADIGLFSFPGCSLVTDNSLVIIGQDFRGGRYMHMVRARATVFPFIGAEGYTFSVGLSPLPLRSTPAHLNPFY